MVRAGHGLLGVLMPADTLVAASTIALSTDVEHGSESVKRRPREIYNDVRERLVENVRELDPEAAAEVEEARSDESWIWPTTDCAEATSE